MAAGELKSILPLGGEKRPADHRTPGQALAGVSSTFANVRRVFLLRSLSPDCTLAKPLKVAGMIPVPSRTSPFCTGATSCTKTNARSFFKSLALSQEAPCPATPESLPSGPKLPAVISQSDGIWQTALKSTPHVSISNLSIPSSVRSSIPVIEARKVLECPAAGPAVAARAMSSSGITTQ
jgi:hypothetical protein